MKLRRSDIRALIVLGLALIALRIYLTSNSTPRVVGSTETSGLLERRLQKVQRVAASVPGKTQTWHAIESQLQTREKGILAFATAPQAQAHLLEVIRRVGSADKIEVRGGDFSAPAAVGRDYGQVAVSVSFEATIDAFVNFLADLSKESELIAPAEIHISTGNTKNKTINVRMTLAGLVQRTLVPEKRSLPGL